MRGLKRYHSWLIIGVSFVTLGVITAVVAYGLGDSTFAVFQPRGEIARKQLDLIILAAVLSLVVVVPVFTMVAVFSWKYRASRPSERYDPEWDSSKVAESIWWGVPIFLIIILSVVTWRSSHELDPYRPLESDKRPLTVQVVALQWRWLFLYPEANVASINELFIPEDRPIEFVITADAPMNSFWIPQLGGQIYAMNGMATKIHLIANEPGIYRGSSANISGEGFADMHFQTFVVSDTEFATWIDQTRRGGGYLGREEYVTLAAPNKQTQSVRFAYSEPGLFDTIVAKFHTSTRYQPNEHRGEGNH